MQETGSYGLLVKLRRREHAFSVAGREPQDYLRSRLDPYAENNMYLPDWEKDPGKLPRTYQGVVEFTESPGGPPLRRDIMFKVAVLGPLGTYTHEAAHKLFGPGVEYDERDTIQGIFDALPAIADAGVVPQENSIFGNVIETYDNLREAGFVRGEVTLEVQHCLLVRPGVKVHDIEKVLSHEQALGQCRDFIRTHLPSASLVKTSSTAAAARALLDNPPNCAAICSKVCAGLFGLAILHEGIQNETANVTRFYLITSDDKIVLPSWLPKNRPSRALIRLLAQIHPSPRRPGISQFLAALQINFLRIDRRPSPRTSLSYHVYFVELQGETNIAVLGDDGWSSEIRRAVQRVEEAGGHAEIIGLWPYRE